MMETFARRRYERINLAEKIIGTLDGGKAVVIDVCLTGALVAHRQEVAPGEKVVLEFDWRGDPIRVEAEIVRTALHQKPTRPGGSPVYRSGIHFSRFVPPACDAVLRSMIEDLVTRSLDEQKANARGIPPEAASSYQRSAATSGYVCYRFVGGAWRRSESSEPEQPLDGFSISVDEDGDNVKLLLEVYARGTRQEREMIRTMAQLSISAEGGIPTRRYEP